MKTVHLIRHAKSSWKHPELSDVQRPLNKRGRKACGIMAPRIVEAGCPLQNVFCSVATRAQLTIQGIADALTDQEVSWTSENQLYTFSSGDLLHFCQGLDDTLDNVVLVGHNPAMTGFTNGMGDHYIDNLPTCGYVQIEFPADTWRELAPESGSTKAILTPKMFR